ncbi:MAG: DUF192 domain-containing protein [Elusimicrobiaceae bacterium]|nr:DUF192 domain-containing protein [Elusimicrobiaceae bacterium]
MTVILPDGFKVNAELALTKAEAEKGLMNREVLPEDSGMLFVFNNETLHYFWMKNTFVNLDMLFISANKTVNEAWENVPRSYVYTPDNQVAVRGGMAKYVLELPAKSITKHNIKIGSKINFDDIKIDYSLVEK